MPKYKYFSKSDFEESDIIRVPCSINDIRPSTLQRFDQAREYAGFPFVVTCGARTLEHEKSRNRNGFTSHLVDDERGIKCKALDLRITQPRKRFIATRALMRAGFTRIGIYPWGLHVDDDEKKPQNVIWHGTH
ncbi:MAG: hypothetical protein HWD92_08845 [Flavobacteriia bacterium]|nr:hypothetical protein [Flavobacteriia bacterium]